MMHGPAPLTGEPRVQLLDASGLGLDAPQLRGHARALSPGRVGWFASRSYRYPYALVAVHAEPVGIDLERVEGFAPEFAASILTPAELDGAMLGADHATASVWSSKEALAKALGDPLSYDPRRLEAPSGWPGGRCGPWRCRRLPAPDGHVAWVCWRSAGPSALRSIRRRGGCAAEPSQ